MVSRFERGFNDVVENVTAYGGWALSALGVYVPAIGEKIVGPSNADGRIAGEYPLTPLIWKPIRAKARTLRPVMALHKSGNPPDERIKPYSPKDMAEAGVASVALNSLINRRGTPVVFWPYGDNHVMVSPIPDEHIDDAVQAGSDVFMWAARVSGSGYVGAGIQTEHGEMVPVNARSEGVVGVDQIPRDQSGKPIPSY